MGTIFVSKDGQVLYEKSFGRAVIEWNVANSNATVYHLASLSKPFTATAILQLEQQGKLSVQDPLSKYISGFTGGNKITLHHLLSHSSGIPNINNMPEYNTLSVSPQRLDSIINVFRSKPLDFEPGSIFSYSNSNYNVLAYIIEKVSGVTYQEFLKRNIFDVAGMSNTLHHGHALEIITHMATGYKEAGRTEIQRAPYLDWSVKTGNGSICSTVEDLNRFDQALYSEKLLNLQSKAKMFAKYLGDVGYGWYIRPDGDRERVYMSGRSPGFSTYYARYPKEKLCVLVLENLYVPSAREIGQSLASIVFNTPYPQRKLADDILSPDKIAEYKGRYEMDSSFFRPGYVLKITEEKGKLICDLGDMLHDVDEEFILRSYWSIIRFQRNAKNHVEGILFDNSIGRKID